MTPWQRQPGLSLVGRLSSSLRANLFPSRILKRASITDSKHERTFVLEVLSVLKVSRILVNFRLAHDLFHPLVQAVLVLHERVESVVRLLVGQAALDFLQSVQFGRLLGDNFVVSKGCD